MEHMMDGGMWGMGIGGFILLILIVLVFAALVKYGFLSLTMRCKTPNGCVRRSSPQAIP